MRPFRSLYDNFFSAERLGENKKNKKKEYILPTSLLTIALPIIGFLIILSSVKQHIKTFLTKVLKD